MSSTLATTPPAAASETLATSAEANDLSSLAGTNLASSVAYSAPFSSYSTSDAPLTVTVGSGTSGSDNSASTASGWDGLSPTTHYAIYAAIGVAALIVIALIIVFAVRRSRKKQRQSAQKRTKGLRNSVRMTQRSSFASPMNLDTYQGAAPSFSSEALTSPSAMTRAETYDSLDKHAYGADSHSIHSIPPEYGSSNKGTDMNPGSQTFAFSHPPAAARYPSSSPAYRVNNEDHRRPSGSSQYSNKYGTHPPQQESFSNVPYNAYNGFASDSQARPGEQHQRQQQQSHRPHQYQPSRYAAYTQDDYQYPQRPPANQNRQRFSDDNDDSGSHGSRYDQQNQFQQGYGH